MPRPRVVHGPRDERVALVVGGVARPPLLVLGVVDVVVVGVLAAADGVRTPGWQFNGTFLA